MAQEPESVPSVVAAAEVWGELHAVFLASVYLRWDQDGTWPDAFELGRQGLRDGWEFDAFELGREIPGPLGRRERGAEERISLRVRGLTFVPPAWPLLHDFMKVIRHGATLFVEAEGKPELGTADLTQTLRLPSRRAWQIAELLYIEGWMLGSGGGDVDGDWHRELPESYRHLMRAQTLEDYLHAEAEQQWARPRGHRIPQPEVPIGDELWPAPDTPAPAVNLAPAPAPPAPVKTAAFDLDGPASVFISYAHEDKALARTFANGLTEHGLEVWIDENELLAGDSIIEQISAAVAVVDFFCPLISEASRESKWCQKELSMAITHALSRNGATVMPLRVGQVEMPDNVSDNLYVALDPANVGAAVERIARDVQRHRERRRRLGRS